MATTNFINIPNGFAKGYANILTNSDNVKNQHYDYDSESDPIVTALDIDWCGADYTGDYFRQCFAKVG